MFRAAILSLSLVAAPAAASSHYHAQPVIKPAAAKLILRDTVWKCGTESCSSQGQSNSRPAIVCALLVKEVGALTSFSAGGAALGPEQLQKCNARAN